MNDNERAAQVASEAASNMRRAVNDFAEQVERHSLNQEGFLSRFQGMANQVEQAASLEWEAMREDRDRFQKRAEAAEATIAETECRIWSLLGRGPGEDDAGNVETIQQAIAELVERLDRVCDTLDACKALVARAP